MTEITPFLKQLISVPGLSGYEAPVRDLIEQEWRLLCDEIHLSRLGNLQALRRGAGPEPRPSLLIAAHMDAIGMLVSGQVGEFLRLAAIGGIDPRILPGQLVTVHGKRELPGVIVQPPLHMLPEEAQELSPRLEYLLVDVGLLPAEVRRLVQLGDLVSFAQPPLEMGDFLAGHSLDNRSSIAALTICLRELQNRHTSWDVWAVATVQEEESLAGALTSAFQLHPSLAVTIDTTYGTGPGSPNHLSFPLDKGPTLAWGPNIHPGLHRTFKEIADRLKIPYQFEPIAADSGTDAMVIQIAAEGIPTMLLEIPLRYMHSPVEMVSLNDVRRTGLLIAEFAAGLGETFLERLSLDD